MTGLIYAAAPLVAAVAVARREPSHRPVALALGASALYSLAALPAVASHLGPRALLGLFALVAVTSGRAYARAFGYRWPLEDITQGIGLCGLAAVVATSALTRWQIWTWGPFVASSLVGAYAVWAWLLGTPIVWGRESRGWRAEPKVAITQRCALVLLASDVCMLAFVRWPGVQAWQGRAAAMAVSVVQIVWLIKERKRHGN